MTCVSPAHWYRPKPMWIKIRGMKTFLKDVGSRDIWPTCFIKKPVFPKDRVDYLKFNEFKNISALKVTRLKSLKGCVALSGTTMRRLILPRKNCVC